jgi:uncharacterized membrane protein
MSRSRAPAAPASARGRFGRESLEFARLVNLSDAVFAIAMTLLVLGLQVPDVRSDALAGELAAMAPHVLAFALGFALVGNLWWQHHALFSRLAHADRGLVALNLLLLGVVAIVPFPTGLVGSYPTSRAAVLPFVATFVVLVGVFVSLVLHAQRAGAWTRPVPRSTFPWVVAGYAVTLVAMVLAAVVTVISSMAGLAVLALSNVPERILATRAPSDYREWA